MTFNMMKQVVCVSVVGLFLGLTPLYAGIGGAFLDNHLDPSTAAIGQIYSIPTLASGVSRVNPAGLAFRNSKSSSVYFSGYQFLETQHLMMGVSGEWVGLPMSLGLMSSDAGRLDETVYDSTTDRFIKTGDTFGYRGVAGEFSSGVRVMDGVSVGGRVIVISETLQSFRGQGLSSDFGVLVGFPLGPEDTITFGLQVQNILSTGIQWNTSSRSKSQLPKRHLFGIGISFFEESVHVVGELDFVAGQAAIGRVGIVYYLDQQILLRGGYNQGSFSFGTGFVLGSFQLDYAYVGVPTAYRDVLEAHSRIGIVLNFP